MLNNEESTTKVLIPVIGLFVGGVMGVVTLILTRAAKRDMIDAEMIERLMQRISVLENQNASQSAQIDNLQSDLAGEKYKVMTLEQELRDIRKAM